MALEFSTARFFSASVSHFWPSGRPGSLVGPISFWANGAQPEHPDLEVSRPVYVSTKPEYLWPVGKPTRQR